MELCKITAIIQPQALERVQEHLERLLVPGMTTTKVMGFGEYANSYRHDPRTRHVLVTLFVTRARADELAEAIAEVAHTGSEGDGLVAIERVDRIIRIRTRADLVDPDSAED